MKNNVKNIIDKKSAKLDKIMEQSRKIEAKYEDVRYLIPLGTDDNKYVTTWELPVPSWCNDDPEDVINHNLDVFDTLAAIIDNIGGYTIQHGSSMDVKWADFVKSVVYDSSNDKSLIYFNLHKLSQYTKDDQNTYLRLKSYIDANIELMSKASKQFIK